MRSKLDHPVFTALLGAVGLLLLPRATPPELAGLRRQRTSTTPNSAVRLRSCARRTGRGLQSSSAGTCIGEAGDERYSIRTGESAVPVVFGMPQFEYLAAHPNEAAAFNDGQAALTRLVGAALIATWNFKDAAVVADIGGGTGTMLATILAANPALRGVLFDLPAGVAGAKALLAAHGVADRCLVSTGSFFDALPNGADTHILKSVLHNWDDEHAADDLAILPTRPAHGWVHTRGRARDAGKDRGVVAGCTACDVRPEHARHARRPRTRPGRVSRRVYRGWLSARERHPAAGALSLLGNPLRSRLRVRASFFGFPTDQQGSLWLPRVARTPISARDQLQRTA